MKKTSIITLSLLAVANGNASEENTKKLAFTPQLALAGGANLPIPNAQIEFSSDAHGVLGWNTAKRQGSFEGGINVGLEFVFKGSELELKPLGIHIHAENGELEKAYSFEAMLELDSKHEPGIGLAFAYSGNDAFEIRVPFQFGRFSSTLYLEREEGEITAGANYSVHFKLGEHVQIGPTIDINTEHFGVGLSARFGHAHAF